MGKFQLEIIRSENGPSTCHRECGSANYILVKMPCYCRQRHAGFQSELNEIANLHGGGASTYPLPVCTHRPYF